MIFDTSKINTRHILIAGSLIIAVLLIWWYFDSKKKAKQAAEKAKQATKSPEQLTEEQKVIENFANNLVNLLAVFAI